MASITDIISTVQNGVVAINNLTKQFKNMQKVMTASLSSDATLNSTSVYTDGPSINLGSSGTWWISGQVTITDPTGVSLTRAKLWDGTTVINSAAVTIPGGTNSDVISLAGYITNPRGNVKISCLDENATAFIVSNRSGNSKDSTISALRIA